MRFLAAFTVAVAALVAGPLLPSQPAAASCAAPTVKVKPVKVARGAVVTITGQYFGDDCLDTGTLPPGAGVLGNPLTGLAIVIDQGSNEFVLATGSADSNYRFQVDVVVPAELEPGDAFVVLLGAGDARLTTDLPLVITSAPPIGAAEATVATFGPTTTDTEPVGGSVPPPVLPADIPDQPAATVPPLSTAPTEVTTSKGDQRRAIGVGIALAVTIAATGFAVWRVSKRRGQNR